MITPDLIEAHYGLSVTSLALLPDSSRAWKIKSDRGALVLRLFESESASDHTGEIAALQFLADSHFPAPRLLAAKDGQVFSKLGKKTGYITTFIPGILPPATIDSAKRLGQTSGRLHALDAIKADLPDTTFTIASERQFFESLDTDPAVQAWKGYSETRDQLVAAWKNLSNLDAAPQALIHTDILFENAVRVPSGAVILIDWDGAGIGPAIQDVGYFLVEQAVSLTGEQLSLDNALAFLSGYTTERHLNPLEWDLLPEALIFGAIVYVMVPWDEKVSMGIWRRAKYVLDHNKELRDKLWQGIAT